MKGIFIMQLMGDSWTGSKTNTALSNCKLHFKFAVHYAKLKQDEMMYDALGRALHYIQDASEPHHASNITVANPSHWLFESFVTDNIEAYVKRITTLSSNYFDSNITYNSSSSSSIDFVLKDAAKIAYNYRNRVNNALNKSQWNSVANRTVPNAVGFSSLLLYKVSVDSGRPLYEV